MKSVKVIISDLDLDYFKQIVEEQLFDAYVCAGVLEDEIKKNGDRMLIMPREEVRRSFIAMSKGDVKTFDNIWNITDIVSDHFIESLGMLSKSADEKVKSNIL
ncbi:MAG: hypothetical protein EZS28_051670, partial [Streblomastix strix]